MILTLQPVGRVDAFVLEGLRDELARFGEVRVAAPKPVPRRAYRRWPKQFRASGFDEVCRDANGDRVLAITDVPLSDPDLGMKRVFGHADMVGRWAVVSLASFGGAGPEKLIERAVKTAVHELGHTLGLGHDTARPECVMYFSEEVADTDRKGAEFCAQCSESAKVTLTRLGM